MTPSTAANSGPRADAPAQRLLIGMPVLANVPVRRAMAPPHLVITAGTSIEAAQDLLAKSGLTGAPVVDSEGRFEGTIPWPTSRRAKELAIAWSHSSM